MNDRELLEWAAKAIGVDYSDALHDLNETAKRACIGQSWNPRRRVQYRGALDAPDWKGEEGRPNPYAATRRAIVMAAAEIGKTMEEEKL